MNATNLKAKSLALLSRNDYLALLADYVGTVEVNLFNYYRAIHRQLLLLVLLLLVNATATSSAYFLYRIETPLRSRVSATRPSEQRSAELVILNVRAPPIATSLSCRGR
jgi:hypothetical protein